MRREKMELLAVDLLLTSTLAEVAEKNRISVNALYKVRQQDEFKAILNEQKNRLFGEAAAKMQGYSLEAVERLMDIIRSPAVLDANKINAIRIILDNSRTAFERDSLLPKIEELERQLDAIESEGRP